MFMLLLCLDIHKSSMFMTYKICSVMFLFINFLPCFKLSLICKKVMEKRCPAHHIIIIKICPAHQIRPMIFGHKHNTTVMFQLGHSMLDIAVRDSNLLNFRPCICRWTNILGTKRRHFFLLIGSIRNGIVCGFRFMRGASFE